MRVLHIASGIDPSIGGPVAALQGLALAQRAHGLEVDVISSFRQRPDPGPTQRMRAGGINVETIGPTRGRLARHPSISAVLNSAIPQADIVHIHALWEDIQHQAAVIARRKGVPYIFRPCGMLDPWSLSQNRLVKQLFLALRVRRDLNGAGAIHYTADAERDLAAPVRLRSAPFVEPNGVDLDAYRTLPSRGAFRKQLQIPADRRLLLFLSRIHPKKGLDLLIPAFANVVKASATPPLLAIVGPDHDAYRPTVESMIDRHCVREHVRWIGMLLGDAKVQAYVDSDLFVLPSYQENFGIVVAEAMAAGLAVIISNKVNLDRDVLACGGGGVVSTQVEPLQREIIRWLRDGTARIAAGQAGRAYAFDRFSWDRIAERLTSVYERVISESQSAR